MSPSEIKFRLENGEPAIDICIEKYRYTWALALSLKQVPDKNRFTTGRCGLCTYYATCGLCPLSRVDQICGVSGSIFQDFILTCYSNDYLESAASAVEMTYLFIRMRMEGIV